MEETERAEKIIYTTRLSVHVKRYETIYLEDIIFENPKALLGTTTLSRHEDELMASDAPGRGNEQG